MLYFVPRETTGGNEMPPSNTASIARRYRDAWNAHDLDEIVAMQIPEMEFELKLTGYPPARGVAEVAQQFRFLFVSWVGRTRREQAHLHGRVRTARAARARRARGFGPVS
jgi:hypothetical protein